MQNKKISIAHLSILLCLSVFAFATHSVASQKDGLLKVYFFDVGQGDAIFIETPSGQQILIDGGSGNQVLSKLGEVMPFFDKDLDLVVMTHPDADHASGLVSVLERYGVGSIIFSDYNHESSLYDTWRGKVIEEGSDVVDPATGKIIDFNDGATLTVLYPLKSLAGHEIKKTNDNSIVVILKYDELEILLTGDIESKGERAILLENINVDADVLKVAHHGSKTSTTEEFLSAVSPDVAIIQVGEKNRYGHPAPEVLERLEDYGIKVYRNDLNGNIKIVSDGQNYLISAEK